jgi:hypothetical protein
MSPTSLSPAPRSNVYYLAPSEAEPVRRPKLSTSLVLRLRLLAFWWRLKLTAAETWDALRRFGRPELPVEDAVVLEQRADMILAARPRPLGPARIIDLDTARVRLRG